MFKNFSQKNQLGGGQLHPLYASDNKLFQKEIITFFSNALWIHLRTVCGPLDSATNWNPSEFKRAGLERKIHLNIQLVEIPYVRMGTTKMRLLESAKRISGKSGKNLSVHSAESWRELWAVVVSKHILLLFHPDSYYFIYCIVVIIWIKTWMLYQACIMYILIYICMYA